MENSKNTNLKMEKQPIEIIPFENQYANYFYNLNIEWLEKYFYVEPYDKKVLSNPQEYIIDNNGYIFFVKYNHKIVGTLAFINQKECYELSKMAISPKYQGLKIGQQLMEYAIQFSKEKDWAKIMLYSNTILKPAIKLYKKMGFIEVPLEENSHYERSNIKMILHL